MSSELWHVVKCVLYELQPFRVVDVINFSKYVFATSKDLGAAGVTFSDFAYQTSFHWIGSLTTQTWVYIILWLAALASMNYAGFGSLWILLSMFASIFLNLGERKRGEMSAYSVFNEGFQQLLGTMNAEQFDNEIRHNHHRFEREDLEDLDGHNWGEFGQDSGSEDDEFAHPRNNNRNNRLRARHQQRVARAALAVQDNLAHGEVQRGENNAELAAGVGMGGAPRRKGKKGRRNYEERLVRREAATLQRQQLEEMGVDVDGGMGGEFGFGDEFGEDD